MATSSWTRRRAGLVVAASAAAVLTVTSMAGAHEGNDDPDGIHACVATNGALRVLSDPGQNCRATETALHWTVGDGSTAELDEFKAQLLATDNVSDLVDWSNLADVPGWIAGGVDYSELTGTPADNSVDGSTVADGSLTHLDVADDSLVSADIVNGTVQSEDLAPGAVNAGTIQDGTVQSEDLAGSYFSGTAGAVTSEKILDGTVEPRDLRPEVSSAVPSAAAVALSTTAAALGTAVVQATAGSFVTISGQVQVSWTGPCGDCRDVVSYQLFRNDEPVGPVYRLQLSEDHAEDVASVAVLDTAQADGWQHYALRLSTDGASAGIGASNLVLTAQVLGGN